MALLFHDRGSNLDLFKARPLHQPHLRCSIGYSHYHLLQYSFSYPHSQLLLLHPFYHYVSSLFHLQIPPQFLKQI